MQIVTLGLQTLWIKKSNFFFPNDIIGRLKQFIGPGMSAQPMHCEDEHRASWSVQHLWSTFLTQPSTPSANSSSSGFRISQAVATWCRHYFNTSSHSKHRNMSIPHVLSTTIWVKDFRNSYKSLIILSTKLKTLSVVEHIIGPRTWETVTRYLYCFFRDLLILKEEIINYLSYRWIESRLTVLEELQSSLVRCPRVAAKNATCYMNSAIGSAFKRDVLGT